MGFLFYVATPLVARKPLFNQSLEGSALFQWSGYFLLNALYTLSLSEFVEEI